MTDQAANLRRLAHSQFQKELPPPTPGGAPIIAVTSAKGGVGKSTVSLYLSYFLAESGARVLLLDTNLSSPSLHIMIGNDNHFSLHQFIANGNEVVTNKLEPIFKQFYFIPNPNHRHSDTLKNDLPTFLEQLNAARSHFDFIILDTETGLNHWNISLLLNSDENLVLSFSDPTAIIDTYLYFKTILEFAPLSNFRIVFTQILEEKYGTQAIEKLNLALSNFLNTSVQSAGFIPLDIHIKKSIQNQVLPWHNSCNTLACQQIKKLANRIRKRLKEQNFQQDEPNSIMRGS